MWSFIVQKSLPRVHLTKFNRLHLGYRPPLVRNITSQGPPVFALNQLNQKSSLSVSLLPLLDLILIDDSYLITKISSPSTLIFALL